jgi:hypothetical protein
MAGLGDEAAASANDLRLEGDEEEEEEEGATDLEETDETAGAAEGTRTGRAEERASRAGGLCACPYARHERATGRDGASGEVALDDGDERMLSLLKGDSDEELLARNSTMAGVVGDCCRGADTGVTMTADSTPAIAASTTTNSSSLADSCRCNGAWFDGATEGSAGVVVTEAVDADEEDPHPRKDSMDDMRGRGKLE